jgi:hypothetical protein
MRLSTAKTQNATAQKKTVRLFDGRGLYLEWWSARRESHAEKSAPYPNESQFTQKRNVMDNVTGAIALLRKRADPES